MPNIDKLVETALENKRLSLLDTYLGYHQVPMTLEDLPKSIKDVQRLTGQVATFHKFVSKSVDKCLLLFKIMRSIT